MELANDMSIDRGPIKAFISKYANEVPSRRASVGALAALYVAWRDVEAAPRSAPDALVAMLAADFPRWKA